MRPPPTTCRARVTPCWTCLPGLRVWPRRRRQVRREPLRARATPNCNRVSPPAPSLRGSWRLRPALTPCRDTFSMCGDRKPGASWRVAAPAGGRLEATARASLSHTFLSTLSPHRLVWPPLLPRDRPGRPQLWLPGPGGRAVCGFPHSFRRLRNHLARDHLPRRRCRRPARRRRHVGCVPAQGRRPGRRQSGLHWGWVWPRDVCPAVCFRGRVRHGRPGPPPKDSG